MHLYQDQKTWAKLLNKREVNSFEEFLLKYSGLKMEKVKHTENNIKDELIVDKQSELEIFQRIHLFIDLTNRLRREGLLLIEKIKDSPNRNIPSAFYDSENITGNSSYLIHQITTKNYFERYFPSPGLQEFIDNNYKTLEEQRIEGEIKDRKRSQKLTILVAVISIVASALTAWFQYSINTQERNVTIENPLELPDTLNVRIANDEVLRLDDE